MQKRIKTALCAVIILAIGVMSIRLIITVFPQKAQKADTREGISYIEARDLRHTAAPVAVPVTEPITAPPVTEPPATAPPETQPAPTQPPMITDGNYKAAYKDILIVGDSLVEAIVEYGVLEDTQVYGAIGAGTAHLKENLARIIAENPPYLVLHYGENELDETENAVHFINRYKACIQQLQQQLPHTKIFVDSIFPVKEIAYESEPYTRNIDYYNALLAQMAAELNVYYLDFTPLWQSFTTEYYDADGIHPLRSFYTEQYLPYVYTEVKSKN